MRLAVLADVHGNLPALEAVLNDIHRRTVEGIIVAGDHTALPHANETIRLLRSLGSWMIRGNSDDNLLRYDAGDTPEAWRTSRQFGLLRFAHRHLNKDSMEYLKSLPEQRVIEIAGTVPIRVVHGSPWNPSEGLSPDWDLTALNLALTQTPEPVLICGHTHIPWKFERDGKLAFNPGAVCGPLHGDMRAQYAVVTWQDDRWEVEHYAVPYDLTQMRRIFQESGLLEEGGALARAFLLSIETGQNVGEDWLSFTYRLAAETGFKNCDVVPDAIWEQAAATFDWDKYKAESASSTSEIQK
jgi:putative phosphoesterase